jgi:tetratricopeptide (TPR) repeat protein
LTACERGQSRLAALGFAALTFVVAVALPTPALAEPQPPSAGAKVVSERAKSAAQQHLQRGNELFRRDEITAALAEFQAAFDLYPSPKLHFNLGQCERALGHAEAAAAHFERFLAEASDVSPDLRAEAQRYLAEARPAVAPEPPPAAAPPNAPDAGTSPSLLPAAPPPSAPLLAAPSAPPPAPASLYKRWWFWASVGAVIAGGAVLTFVLTSPRDPPCNAGLKCY